MYSMLALIKLKVSIVKDSVSNRLNQKLACSCHTRARKRQAQSRGIWGKLCELDTVYVSTLGEKSFCFSQPRNLPIVRVS